MTFENRAANGWAVVVPVKEATAIVALRLRANLEVAVDGDVIWLRGRTMDDSLSTAIAGLPAIERYTWEGDDTLRRPGARLVVRTLPVLSWQGLASWARVTLPIAVIPAALPAPGRLEFSPIHAAQPANALLVRTVTLLDWMEQAPQLRLRPLRYAASDAGMALVLGNPLPPVPGRAAIEDGGIILPAGFALRPHVSAVVIRRILNVPDGTLVWWDESGLRVLSAELFVPASRGAARLTRAAIAS